MPAPGRRRGAAAPPGHAAAKCAAAGFVATAAVGVAIACRHMQRHRTCNNSGEGGVRGRVEEEVKYEGRKRMMCACVCVCGVCV